MGFYPGLVVSVNLQATLFKRPGVFRELLGAVASLYPALHFLEFILLGGESQVGSWQGEGTSETDLKRQQERNG